MNSLNLRWIWIFSLWISLTGNYAFCTNYMKILDVTGDYKHCTTDIIFPEHYNQFTRDGITAFNRERTDICASYIYDNPNVDIKFSIYIYPAPVALEHRLRDEFYLCLQAISNVQDEEIVTSAEPIKVRKDGYQVIGLSATINKDHFKSVLALFECGKYFLEYRISSSKIDTLVLNNLKNKLTQQFSPVEIVKKQPLLQGVTVHVSPGITTDTISLIAILAAVHAKIEWVYDNVDSLERCSGFPGLYFEEQKVALDSMLNRWEGMKHNNTQFDKYFDELSEIRKSGFLSEFICDEYWSTLILPDFFKPDWVNYNNWKTQFKPTVKLTGGYYYLLGFEKSYGKLGRDD